MRGALVATLKIITRTATTTRTATSDHFNFNERSIQLQQLCGGWRGEALHQFKEVMLRNAEDDDNVKELVAGG